MGLIDLGRVTTRAFGGGGFAIKTPQTSVRFESSEQNKLANADLLETGVRLSIEKLLRRLEKFDPETHATVDILQMPPSHHGFGSKTALLLAIVEGFCRLGSRHCSMQQKQLLSGRGGTSGVGIHTFFSGGVVRDNGRSWTEVAQIGPSSSQVVTSVPELTKSLPFPANWTVHLFRPTGHVISGQDETRFFAENTPTTRADVECALSAFDELVMPGFEVADFEKLQAGVRALNRSGFKLKEIRNQPENVSRVLHILNAKRELAAGLSSFGPTIYAICQRDAVSPASFLEIANECQTGYEQSAPVGLNQGYRCIDE